MTEHDKAVFSPPEQVIIETVRSLRDSLLFAALKAAYAAGEPRVFTFKGRKLFVEPEAPFAGFTWLAENAFHLGAEAFESD